MLTENPVIGCTGVHHIALHASDFAASYRFYTEALGFTEYRRWKTGDGRTICLLELGGGVCVELFSDGKKRTCFEEQAGLYVHLALHVKDSRKAFEQAVAHGAQPKKTPEDMLLPSEPPIPATISFVKGPDGEEIEFFEVRE